MVLRLDPDHPMVWRTPDSVQFGVEAPVLVLAGVTARVERFLGALALGIAMPALGAVADESGLNDEELDALLIELEPVLEEEPSRAPLAGLRVVVDGRGPAAEAVARLVHGLGASLASGAGEDCGVVDIAVVISHYATPPRRAATWLRDDVRHLLVEFGDRSIRVGPLVSPGLGPCAECLELARTDADPAWPAIATQAMGRPAPSADVLGVAAAVAVAGRMLVARRRDAEWAETAVRIPRLGFDPAEVSLERHRAHPRCGCRSPSGNARERVLHCGVIRPPPTRARASPGPG